MTDKEIQEELIEFLLGDDDEYEIFEHMYKDFIHKE